MEHLVVIVIDDVTGAVVTARQFIVDMRVLVMAHISFQVVFSFLGKIQDFAKQLTVTIVKPINFAPHKILYIQHKKSAGMVIKTLPFTLLLIL
jgi:hypothetical protein